MIHNIRGAFNELLADNHWMDPETRMVAKEKANAMNERIGYPEILTDRDELEKEYDNVIYTKFLIPKRLSQYCLFPYIVNNSGPSFYEQYFIHFEMGGTTEYEYVTETGRQR